MEYRVMDRYGYSMEYFDTKEEAIEFCKNNPFAQSVEECEGFDTIYEK